MKLGRNDPCHCGSGKKYKKCCMEKDEAARPAGQEQMPEVDEKFDHASQRAVSTLSQPAVASPPLLSEPEDESQLNLGTFDDDEDEDDEDDDDDVDEDDEDEDEDEDDEDEDDEDEDEDEDDEDELDDVDTEEDM